MLIIINDKRVQIVASSCCRKLMLSLVQATGTRDLTEQQTSITMQALIKS